MIQRRTLLKTGAVAALGAPALSGLAQLEHLQAVECVHRSLHRRPEAQPTNCTSQSVSGGNSSSTIVRSVSLIRNGMTPR